MMISKLKAECGHQFTSRLEGMFNDIKISRDMMNDFKNQRQFPFRIFRIPSNSECCANSESKGGAQEADINVTVLTTGFWPVTSSDNCKLPAEAKEAADKFKTFYGNRNKGRRLTWQTQMGTAELLCNFKKGRRLLAVHTYQVHTRV
eukprot:1369001-Amorphochlora_amoeboformis.AAC.1